MTRTSLSMRLAGALIALALLLTAAVAGARPAEAQSRAPGLVLFFEGLVESGPSAGTVLEGDLALASDGDSLYTGSLITPDGAEIPVTGRIAGGNVSVTFILGDDSFIFGIGTIDEEGVISGPFVGPQGGDTGSWQAIPVTNLALDFSGAVVRGPSAGTTIAGPLTLRLIGDEFTGDLKTADGRSVPVRGFLSDGRGATWISIIFDLGNGQTIRGAGTQAADGSFSGSFRGPSLRDRGTWTATPTNF